MQSSRFSSATMTFLTEEDVKIVVSQALGPDVKIVSHLLKPLDQKNGILGTHFSLSVDCKAETNDVKSYSFFAKTLPNSPIIQDLILDEYTFLEEVHFCGELLPRLFDYYKNERWMAQCYLAKGTVLVFEDLRAQGYAIRSSSFLEEKFLKSALSSLARFHAASVLFEHGAKKTLKEAYPTAFQEKMYNDHNKFGKSTPLGYDTIAILAERLHLDSSLVPKIYERVHNLVRGKKGAFNVLCHGDLWKNNIMYDDSNPPKCLLVDFQLLRYASPCVDVCMFLFLHTTPEERKSVELDLFKHYYYALRSTIAENNSTVKIPAYEDFLSNYRECRLVGMTYAALYLPGIYLNPIEFQKMLNDPKALETWFFHNRIDVIRTNMEADSSYEKKINDIICELLEEAKRLFQK